MKQEIRYDASLENQIEEAKRYENFRKEKKTGMFKRSNPLGIILISAGVLTMLTTLSLLVFYNKLAFLREDSVALIFVIIGAVLGLFFVIFGSVIRHREKKRVIKGNDLEIISEDEYFYADGITDDEVRYVDINLPIHEKKKEERKFVNPLADLEDEDEALGYNSRMTVRTYEAFDLDSKILKDRFMQFGKKNHILVDLDSTTVLISHLAYSRLLLLTDVRKEHRIPLVSTLKDTISENIFRLDCTSVQDEDGLISLDGFSKAFETAEKDPDSFVFVVLDNMTCRISDYLKDFLPPLYDKNNRHKVLVGKKNFQLNTNIYFLFFLDDQKSLEKEDKDLLFYAPLIPLEISTETGGEFTPLDKRLVSVSDFEHVIELEKPKYHLEESVWRKFDAFSDFVSTLKPYNIGNDIENDLEREVSLSWNGSLDDIVDDILSVDLLPYVLKDLNGEGRESLIRFIRDEFQNDFVLKKTERLFALSEGEGKKELGL